MSVFLNDKLTLNNLKVGDTVKVLSVSDALNLKTKRRLLELGFVQDASIIVHNFSSLKDVILVEINGYMLSLRNDVAKYIFVKGDKE